MVRIIKKIKKVFSRKMENRKNKVPKINVLKKCETVKKRFKKQWQKCKTCEKESKKGNKVKK